MTRVAAALPHAGADDTPRITQDMCVLPLVRRLAAMLDRNPGGFAEGDALPRGWHPMLFNDPTPQSQLRADGAAHLGVPLPDLGLPRLMFGGRQIRFAADIPIGARVRRETRRGEVQRKSGRSGDFALVKVEHRIFVAGGLEPAVIEHQDYVLRGPAAPTDKAPAPAAQAAPAAAAPIASRTIVPDERLLFRYSAITDNPHRIHYDQPYATANEGYPALVVNGNIPALFLLEMLRAAGAPEPSRLTTRNVAPMFCGQQLHLRVSREAGGWLLRAENDAGQTTFDALAA